MTMARNDRSFYVIILIFGLLVLAGFYFVFAQLSDLRTEVKNVELQLSINTQGNQPSPGGAVATTTTQTPPQPVPSGNAIVIPTAIIFDAQSSPALLPQATLAVTVENVTKQTDGTVEVNVKVFSSNASGYTALNPSDLFQVVSLEGDMQGNQLPTTTEGGFNSIPPKSVISGKITFKISPTQPTFILQTGSGDSIKYYEFNFSSKTYKEAALG